MILTISITFLHIENMDEFFYDEVTVAIWLLAGVICVFLILSMM